MNALVIIAEMFEDIETVTVVDVLNRAGIIVTVAALHSGPVKGAYGNTLQVDTDISDIEGLYDAIVLPGGKVNADSLAGSTRVIDLLNAHAEQGRLIAAICASSPLVLAARTSILKGKRATGWPQFDDILKDGGATVSGELVTADGNVITGMGVGAALPFALRIVEFLLDKQTADRMADMWWIKQ